MNQRIMIALAAAAAGYLYKKDKKTAVFAGIAGYFAAPYLMGGGSTQVVRLAPKATQTGATSPGQVPNWGRLVQQTGEAIETLFKKDIKTGVDDVAIVTDPGPLYDEGPGRGGDDYAIV